MPGSSAISPQDDGRLEAIEAHKIDRLRSIEELRAVHRASIRLQRTLDPQELAAETICVLEDTLGYELGAVLLIDGSSDRLTPFALSDQNKGPEFVDEDRENILSYDVRLGHGITGWVAANGITVRSADVNKDPRYLGIRSGIVSELCVPMRVRGRVIGVVNVETSRANAYTQSDQRVMEIIASHIAVAIENSRLHQALVHSQRLDAIGRLTSGIAHDFNNLLTVITGYADLILGRDDLDSSVREGVEQIKIAGNQSANMTQQLLAFSRKTVLRTVVLDPNEEIAGLEIMLQRLLGDAVRLSIQYEAVGSVKVDPTQFSQILVNLAVNAREAMPDGGAFSITTSTAIVSDRSGPGVPEIAAGQYTVITVTDTGHGMDEVTRQSVFEPFFSTKDGGTGLGLAMAYGAARQSGGGISVESRPGRGARFTIYLPVAAPLESETNPADPVASISGRVLVVDDDKPVRDLVVAVLESLGYSALAAKSGAEALDIAARPDAKIEIVVSDVVMPGMDGPTFVKALRERHPGVAVLYMSAYPARNIDKSGAFAESEHLLTKPFTRDTLKSKILEVLSVDRSESRELPELPELPDRRQSTRTIAGKLSEEEEAGSPTG